MEFARQSANDIIKKHLPQIEEYCNIINAMYGVLYEALAKNRGVFGIGETTMPMILTRNA